MHQPSVERPGKRDGWEAVVGIGLMELGPGATAVTAVQDGGVVGFCFSGRVETDRPSFSGAKKRNIHKIASGLAIPAGSVDPSDPEWCGGNRRRAKHEDR